MKIYTQRVSNENIHRERVIYTERTREREREDILICYINLHVSATTCEIFVLPCFI